MRKVELTRRAFLRLLNLTATRVLLYHGDNLLVPPQDLGWRMSGRPLAEGGTDANGETPVFSSAAVQSDVTIGAVSSEAPWPMAGANPQRTSWTPEEVRGRQYPVWAVNIEPFIPFANQMIAANDTIYVSTAKGLYALSSETGALRWVFPTELPLGHSPTVTEGVLYVGGYDHHLYALDAYTGQLLWSYEASSGFATNPLVVEGMVILGNRDGHLYAIHTNGSLAWRFPTDGPILFSAAYKDGVVYFASNDSCAYAVATDGTMKWKSAKLPGGGFYSYWPVIYTKDGRDYIVLGGSNDYRATGVVGAGRLNNDLDRAALYYDIGEAELVGPTGTVPGDWAPGTVTIDDSRAIQYLEGKPDRRRVFLLDASTGQEVTFDSDGDGRAEYAPITWFGTHGGNRYPAVVGSDGVLYQGNSYISNPYIPRGGPAGWKFGTQYISRVHEGNYGAVDEPMSVSGGGNVLYWGWLGGLRGAGAYDITIPYGDPDRAFGYGGSANPDWLLVPCPGTGIHFGVGTAQFDEPLFYTAGGSYGIYGAHGNPNPPIPYKGKVYFHSMNTVFGLSTLAACRVTSLPAFQATPVAIRTTKDDLRQRLTTEVRTMIDAGHLRPGYHEGTLGTNVLCLEQNSFILDYFHNPADTFVTLIAALPHLSPELQQQTRDYLQSEWALSGDKVHIGWQDGAARETYLVPPEIVTKMGSFGPKESTYGSTWDYRYSLYGRWRYIDELGDQTLAANVFQQIRNTAPIYPPEDDPHGEDWAPAFYLPYIKNAFIAGYIGYIGIGRTAGISETELAPYVAELNRLLAERANELLPYVPEPVRQANVLTVARNFIYMTPEIADYLRLHALDRVRTTLADLCKIAPYWFVSRYDATSYEGVLHLLYDYPALFQAKALILQEPFEELVKWLDVPAFVRGDLFYIQNLTAALGAPWLFTKVAAPSSGSLGDTVAYTLEFHGQGTPALLTDDLPVGVSQPFDLRVQGTTVIPQYDPDAHTLAWSDTPADGQRIVIEYKATIVTGEPEQLVNTAELLDATGDPRSASAAVFANPKQIHLPFITRMR